MIYAFLLMLIVRGKLLPEIYAVFLVAYRLPLKSSALVAEDGEPPYPEWGICTGLKRDL